MAGSASLVVLVVACHQASSSDAPASAEAVSSVVIASAAPDPRYIPKPSAEPEASVEAPKADARASAQALPKAPATARAKTVEVEHLRPAAPTASSRPAPDPPSTSAVEAKPPPPPPKQHVVRGTTVGAEHFTLFIQAPTPVQVGKTAAATIVLTAKSPFHCNDKYPYKFKLDAPGGAVSYPAGVARGMNVSGTHGSLAVPFSVRQAGTARISGTLYMSICSADKCLMDRRRLTIAVQVL